MAHGGETPFTFGRLIKFQLSKTSEFLWSKRFYKLKTRIYHCRNNLLEGTGRYSKGEVRQVSHGPVEVVVSRVLIGAYAVLSIAFLEVERSIRLWVTSLVEYCDINESHLQHDIGHLPSLGRGKDKDTHTSVISD